MASDEEEMKVLEIPQGHGVVEIKYTLNEDGTRNYHVNAENEQVLLEYLEEERKAKRQEKRRKYRQKWKEENPNTNATYQQRTRRRRVINRHLPQLGDDEVERLVNICMNRAEEYRKDPVRFIKQMAAQHGLTDYCPVCHKPTMDDESKMLAYLQDLLAIVSKNLDDIKVSGRDMVIINEVEEMLNEDVT